MALGITVLSHWWLCALCNRARLFSLSSLSQHSNTLSEPAQLQDYLLEKQGHDWIDCLSHLALHGAFLSDWRFVSRFLASLGRSVCSHVETLLLAETSGFPCSIPLPPICSLICVTFHLLERAKSHGEASLMTESPRALRQGNSSHVRAVATSAECDAFMIATVGTDQKCDWCKKPGHFACSAP